MGTYNGWRNWATWCVNLWLENSEPTYRYWLARAKEALVRDDSDLDSAAALGELMEQELSDGIPPLSGLYSDMFQATWEEIDWEEIATHWLVKARES